MPFSVDPPRPTSAIEAMIVAVVTGVMTNRAAGRRSEQRMMAREVSRNAPDDCSAKAAGVG